MGVASIVNGPRPFRFYVDPTDISWGYKLNTSVQDTYGGRVIQILSVSLTQLTVKASSGMRGQAYRYGVVKFCRDLARWQREKVKPVTFLYPPRNINLKVFLTNISYTNQLEDVEKSFIMRFNIDDDVTGGVKSVSMNDALSRIKNGTGFNPQIPTSSTTPAVPTPPGIPKPV